MARSRPIFEAFLSEIQKIDRVLRISIDGIRALSESVPLHEALAELDRIDGKITDASEQERHLEAVRERTAFAKEEVENGFATIHGQATVALWGALESFVEDLAIFYLQNEPSLLRDPTFSGIRVSLAEFEATDPEDRLRLLLREYARQKKADLKFGVTGFELLLEPVGLAGPVADEMRRNLFEISQVRSVLVHRSGVTDSRLVRSCPWLGLKQGQQVHVSAQDYARYLDSVQKYTMELIVRSLVRRGRTRAEAERLAGARDASEQRESPAF